MEYFSKLSVVETILELGVRLQALFGISILFISLGNSDLITIQASLTMASKGVMIMPCGFHTITEICW